MKTSKKLIMGLSAASIMAGAYGLGLAQGRNSLLNSTFSRQFSMPEEGYDCRLDKKDEQFKPQLTKADVGECFGDIDYVDFHPIEVTEEQPITQEYFPPCYWERCED
ncbi:hypothetical protein HYT24_00645 [Candidatus Pacearchaeota archaeon]|nr:hypothetical protein [Candidatus Pacearchaeota archaeon]